MIVVAAMVLAFPGIAPAGEVQDEIDALKERIRQLERNLASQNRRIDEQGQKIQDHDSDLKQFETVKTAVSGLDIDVSATSVVQGTYNNDDNYEEVFGVPRTGDDWDAQYTVDVAISSKIGETGTALLLLKAGEGLGVNDEVLSFGRPNDDAIGDDADVNVSEVWYEHSFLDGTIVATVGKLDLRRWVDTNAVANDEDTQFLNGAFVNNLAIDLPQDYAEEDFTYGARLSFIPSDMFAINLGYVETDGDFEEIFSDNFYIAEIALKPKFGELQGAYRVYGWLNNSDHTELDDITENDEEGYGAGISIDQQLTPDVTAFGRFGWQDADLYPIEYAWSAGFQVDGNLWGRQDDMFGIAYSRADTSDDYRDLIREQGRVLRPRWLRQDSPFDSKPAEHVAEAYYRIQCNKHLAITPDVQYIENMRGYDSDAVVILGVRAHVSF